MNSFSKKSCALLLAVIFFVSLLPLSLVAYETGDDYPYKASRISTVDQWRFKARWCTSFVAWCLVSRNGITDFNDFYGDVTWGNASRWGATARSLGITVDDNPAVGSVAWKGTHVAWVAEVNGDEVTIEEYNCFTKTEFNPQGKSNVFNRRTLPKTSFSYIHIGDIGPAQNSAIRVFFNEKELVFDVPPYDVNGVTLFPVRTVLEEMGAAVKYESSLKTVTANKGETEVILIAGDALCAVNGQVTPIGQPAVIENGVLLAPLRFVAEAFGGSVVWDEESRTVYITQ